MSLVSLNCFYAEVQFLGNLARAAAFADQAKYLKLTIGKSGEAGVHIRRTAADVLVKQLVCHAIAEVDFSTENAPHGDQDLLRGLLLHDVAISTGPQRALGIN